MAETFYTFGYYLFYGVFAAIRIFCFYRIRKNLRAINEYKKEHPEYNEKKNNKK